MGALLSMEILHLEGGGCRLLFVLADGARREGWEVKVDNRTGSGKARRLWVDTVDQPAAQKRTGVADESVFSGSEAPFDISPHFAPKAP